MLSLLAPKDQKYVKDRVNEQYDEGICKCLKTVVSFKEGKQGKESIAVFCKRHLIIFKENGNKVKK